MTRDGRGNESPIVVHGKRCTCGAPAVDRFRRRWVCRDCLNEPAEPLDVETATRRGSGYTWPARPSGERL